MEENTAAKMTAAFLDSKGLNYELFGDKKECIRTGFGMENVDVVRIYIFFDEDNSACTIKTFDYVKVPKEKYGKIYKVLNHLNREYRWIKFALNEDEGYVVLSDDAVIQLDTCGEEIFRLMNQLALVADDAYPGIQKELWVD